MASFASTEAAWTKNKTAQKFAQMGHFRGVLDSESRGKFFYFTIKYLMSEMVTNGYFGHQIKGLYFC